MGFNAGDRVRYINWEGTVEGKSSVYSGGYRVFFDEGEGPMVPQPSTHIIHEDNLTLVRQPRSVPEGTLIQPPSGFYSSEEDVNSPTYHYRGGEWYAYGQYANNGVAHISDISQSFYDNWTFYLPSGETKKGSEL